MSESGFVVDGDVLSFVIRLFGKHTETTAEFPIVKLKVKVMTMLFVIGQRGVVTGIDDDFNPPTPNRTLMAITRNWFPINITRIILRRFDLIGIDFINQPKSSKDKGFCFSPFPGTAPT